MQTVADAKLQTYHDATRNVATRGKRKTAGNQGDAGIETSTGLDYGWGNKTTAGDLNRGNNALCCPETCQKLGETT